MNALFQMKIRVFLKYFVRGCKIHPKERHRTEILGFLFLDALKNAFR